MSNIWILYQTTNICNGKIYVGVHKLADTSTSRRYLGSGDRITAAIKKYGRQNFIRETLAEFNSCDDVYDAEAKLVTEDFIKREDTYNISLGGRGGGIQTPEMREKISSALKGRKLSKNHAAQIGARSKGNFYCVGRVYSDDTRAKIAEANRRRIVTPETRAKMSASRKGNKNRLGKPCPDEVKAKISAATMGNFWSESSKAKVTGAMNHKSIAVIVDGTYYESAKLASRYLNVDATTVLNRARNTSNVFSNYLLATEEDRLQYSLLKTQN